MREPTARKHVNEMLQFIRTNGGDVKIFHRKNPVDASGNREVWHDVWMTREDEELRHGTPTDTEGIYIHAESCLGYTLAKATIDGQAYVGKSICSSKDNYNGNIGAIHALQDLINQLDTDNHPIANAWTRHVDIQRSTRKNSTYAENVDRAAKVIDMVPTV